VRRSHQSQSPKFGDEDATSLITTCNVPILLIIFIQYPELLCVFIMSAPYTNNLTSDCSSQRDMKLLKAHTLGILLPRPPYSINGTLATRLHTMPAPLRQQRRGTLP